MQRRRPSLRAHERGASESLEQPRHLRHPHRGFQIHREHLREHRLERGRHRLRDGDVQVFSAQRQRLHHRLDKRNRTLKRGADAVVHRRSSVRRRRRRLGGIQRGARCEHRDHPRDVRRRRRRRRSRFERGAQLGALHQPRSKHHPRLPQFVSRLEPALPIVPLGSGHRARVQRRGDAAALLQPPADRLEERDDGAGGKSQAPLGRRRPRPLLLRAENARSRPLLRSNERPGKLRAHAAQQTGPGGYGGGEDVQAGVLGESQERFEKRGAKRFVGHNLDVIRRQRGDRLRESSRVFVLLRARVRGRRGDDVLRGDAEGSAHAGDPGDDGGGVGGVLLLLVVRRLLPLGAALDGVVDGVAAAAVRHVAKHLARLRSKLGRGEEVPAGFHQAATHQVRKRGPLRVHGSRGQRRRDCSRVRLRLRRVTSLHRAHRGREVYLRTRRVGGLASGEEGKDGKDGKEEKQNPKKKSSSRRSSRVRAPR